MRASRPALRRSLGRLASASHRRRQGARLETLLWTLLWTMGVAAPLGCPAPQPSVCQAAMNCLYPNGQIPDGEENAVLRDRYAQCLDDPYLMDEGGNYPNRDATLEAFGPGGGCWAINGEPLFTDPYYASCVEACENVLIEDCFFAETGGTGSFCLDAMRGAGLENTLTCTNFLDSPGTDYRERARNLECVFDNNATTTDPDPEPDMSVADGGS